MRLAQLACVFPGQGSQQVGMLAELSAVLPEIQPMFGRASEVLGYDLWRLVQDGPQDHLNLTEYAQPALLAASAALWTAWQTRSQVRPAYVAGHSLGEWSALVAAEVVTFEDAIQLVRLRGRYMQEAVPAGVGAMAAILGLEDAVVEAACLEASAQGVVGAVNYNSPGQLVIAGEKAAVDAAIAACKAQGAKRALLLPVSAPFHTSLMQPAADRLASHIQQTVFAAPKIPVVHNWHAQPEASPDKIKQLMIEQIYSPVRWVASMQYLAAQGVSLTLELGPGKVLSGLNKRIDKQFNTLASEDLAAWDAALAYFKTEE
jgi:[acyl-carrier-protein] S-malonyltransferase